MWAEGSEHPRTFGDHSPSREKSPRARDGRRLGGRIFLLPHSRWGPPPATETNVKTRWENEKKRKEERERERERSNQPGSPQPQQLPRRSRESESIFCTRLQVLAAAASGVGQGESDISVLREEEQRARWGPDLSSRCWPITSMFLQGMISFFFHSFVFAPRRFFDSW